MIFLGNTRTVVTHAGCRAVNGIYLEDPTGIAWHEVNITIIRCKCPWFIPTGIFRSRAVPHSRVLLCCHGLYWLIGCDQHNKVHSRSTVGTVLVQCSCHLFRYRDSRVTGLYDEQDNPPNPTRSYFPLLLQTWMDTYMLLVCGFFSRILVPLESSKHSSINFQASSSP